MDHVLAVGVPTLALHGPDPGSDGGAHASLGVPSTTFFEHNQRIYMEDPRWREEVALPGVVKPSSQGGAVEGTPCRHPPHSAAPSSSSRRSTSGGGAAAAAAASSGRMQIRATIASLAPSSVYAALQRRAAAATAATAAAEAEAAAAAAEPVHVVTVVARAESGTGQPTLVAHQFSDGTLFVQEVAVHVPLRWTWGWALFVVGWLLPPLWLVGAFLPCVSRAVNDRRAAVASTAAIACGIFIGVGVAASTHA